MIRTYIVEFDSNAPDDYTVVVAEQRCGKLYGVNTFWGLDAMTLYYALTRRVSSEMPTAEVRRVPTTSKEEENNIKQYIGTKLVQAEPAMRYKGQVFTIGDTLPVMAVLNQEVEHGYKVRYADGYESWSPTEVFKKAYRETDGMNFGLAVEAMKQGARVARWCWDESVYLFLGTDVEFHTEADVSEFADQDVPVGDVFVLRSVEKEFVPGWQPNHVDILADDWHIVDELDPDGKRTTLPF